MNSKPNILFFFTDDQRFDTIHALGNPHIHTPNLDALVQSGVSFTHTHIPGGTNAAVCMPSRAMVHSGRDLFRLEREGQNIPDNHTTLGECFRKAGYETFGTGKWHNGPKSYARSFSAGAEVFFHGMWDHWNVPACDYHPSGTYEDQLPFCANIIGSNILWRMPCDHITPGKHSTDLFSDAAIQFLETSKKDKPFFMYVSLMAPHDPRTMPEKYLKIYDPDKIVLPANFLPRHPFDYGQQDIRDEKLAASPRNPREIQQHIAEYYAMISHIDDAFGRVIASLKAQGRYENTLIVFSGDNGLALGQHGLLGKQDLYEHSVRVPLIVSGPGILKNEICESFTYLYDIFPSLCEMSETAVPESVEGTSFAPCLKDPLHGIRDELYLAYEDKIRAVKTRQLKLIEYSWDNERHTQLFDLENDPLEITDLSTQPQYQNTVREMRKKLIAARNRSDEMLHPCGLKFWEGY